MIEDSYLDEFQRVDHVRCDRAIVFARFRDTGG